MAVYKAFMISTLLYGSETWTSYTKHERKLKSFNMRCICRLLGIKWSDKSTQRQGPWTRQPPHHVHAALIAHVYRMEDGRLPKNILNSERASGNKSIASTQQAALERSPKEQYESFELSFRKM